MNAAPRNSSRRLSRPITADSSAEPSASKARPLSLLAPLALGALALLASPLFAQSIVISPAEKVLAGDPVSIQLQGFPPNAEVSITAERPVVPWGAPPTAKALYRAEARFKADAEGRVDLATAKPISGSYKAADVRGLFWSMVPVKGEIPAEWKTSQVKFSAGVEGGERVRASLEMLPNLPGVKTEPVPAFPGALFAHPGEGFKKSPVVILLGGSEGGSLVTRGAAALASHGFAVLALPYYSPAQWPTNKPEIPELPRAFADIPVERLTAARDWLAQRSDVDATRVAVHGTSKGAEYALLAGVHLPWVKSVVAVVPTDVVWEGWGEGTEPGKRSSFSLNGKPLSFVPYKDFAQEFMGFQTGDAVKIRRPQDKGRAANPLAAAKARIPVEKIKAPVMVVGGHDDQVWASGMMAQNIAERRAEAGLDTVALVYAEAGHYLSAHGYAPTTQYDVGPSKGGGTPEANARAQAEAWTGAIQFLKRTLGVK